MNNANIPGPTCRRQDVAALRSNALKDGSTEQPTPQDGLIEILSLGAGVQSSTLLLMSCDGILPKLRAAIFADTQSEPAAVYRYLDFLESRASTAGIPILRGTAGSLRDDLLEFWHQRKSADGKRYASIPAFVKNPDGTRGMVRRQCTDTYKLEVVERLVRLHILNLAPRRHWPKVATIRQWIGISADEVERRRDSRRPAIVNHYPLLDVLERHDPGKLFPRGWTRRDCLDWLTSRGYPRPPRSACTFCPFHSDAEWAAMKANDPEAFADAVRVDRLIREFDRERTASQGDLRGEPYLHSSLIPLDVVEFKPADDRAEGRGMINECFGMCGN